MNCGCHYSTPQLFCDCSSILDHVDLYILKWNVSFWGSLYSKENSFQSYSRHVPITCYISRYDPGDVEITHLNQTEPCPQRVNKLIDVWVNSLRLLGKGSFSNCTPPPSFTQWPVNYKVGQTSTVCLVTLMNTVLLGSWRSTAWLSFRSLLLHAPRAERRARQGCAQAEQAASRPD